MRNILKVYNRATPEDISAGLNWYKEAREFCSELSKKHQISIDRVCYALAALSPNTRWESNKRDLEALLSFGELDEMFNNYENGIKGAYVKLRLTAYSLNIHKAIKILNGDLTSLKGNKVTAFARNILHEDSDVVTVDGHACCIYLGKVQPIKVAGIYVRKNYKKIEKAYKKVAKDLGYKPYELQAITWTVWRNNATR